MANKKYTVISAVYNGGLYLHDYFKSLTQQSLNFRENIQLLLVDDGSTDNSAQVIAQWQKKYPRNIQYLKQANAGQASARNFGLEYVKTPWVTFIDPDDFVNKQYFENIDSAIKKYASSNLSMIGCNIVYYFEKFRLRLDRHPLKYKFKTDNEPMIVKHLDEHIHLSASTAFFRADLIEALQLKFDTKIKPNFEDAHFVNRYLIQHPNTSVIFLKNAKYYYRRRITKDSTIDTSWQKKELYDDVLRYGCLDLFEKADKKLGYIPKFLQKTILYHLSWYFKYIVDHPEVVSFLSKEQKNTFQLLLEENFAYIDTNTIRSFNLYGIGEMIKQGWGHTYKHSALLHDTITLSKHKKTLELQYFSNEPLPLHIEIDNEKIELPEAVIKKHMLLDDTFINEYQLTLPIKSSMQKIDIQTKANKIYLQTGSKKFLDEIKISNIQHSNRKNMKQLLYNLARYIVLGK